MAVSRQFLKNLQPFCLVSFDVNNTLLKYKSPVEQYAQTAAIYGHGDINKRKLAKAIRDEYNLMMAQYPLYGRDGPEMDWYQWWLELVYRCFKSTKPRMPDRDATFLARELVEMYRTKQCWKKMDGGLEFISKLQAAGKSVGVISNFDPSINEILNQTGFGGLDFVVNAYDCGVQKPDKEIFHMAVKKVCVPSRQALHIGDEYREDYLGAQKAGWSSLLVSPSSGRIRSTKKIEKTHVHKSLPSLMDSLDCVDFEW